MLAGQFRIFHLYSTSTNFKILVCAEPNIKNANLTILNNKQEFGMSVIIPFHCCRSAALPVH
jgi:hypothetical protein